MILERRSIDDIERVQPVIGLEVHVELATRRKLFAQAGSPAHEAYEGAPANTLVDPVVLALPGALPVINERAVELSARVGVALGCAVASHTTWDRKSYFYPDLPKGYQISQYGLPVCFDGETRWPIVADEGSDASADADTKLIRIVRAHLEEDAGKSMHEAPADMPELSREMGGSSIVDLNRAGTPLLEIVTAPDFASADEVVRFAQELRRLVRWVGASAGDMQKGHMRFEPNVNCVLHLRGGRVVETPISEIKNLNSFRSVRTAIDREIAAQPKRWVEDGIEHGPGTKSTWGFDEHAQGSGGGAGVGGTGGKLFLMRSKEDAHDYRYFPDPDLPPVRLTEAWIDSVRASVGELPLERDERYRSDFGLDAKAAAALTEDRAESDLFDAAVAHLLSAEGHAGEGGLPREAAGKAAANVLLQGARALAKERSGEVASLGLTPAHVAGVAALRAQDEIDSASVQPLLAELIDKGGTAREAAERCSMLKVTDTGALEGWVDAALADPANEQAVADVRAGKQAAIGRLIGGVMKASSGQADAKAVRAMIMDRL
jgi:aspartyl-tRNA(Asn)/glutamyl-tRNA(Gln) amidotransferase subunit B